MDLGLPSGTLWLDRPLGAASIAGIGLAYAWGALQGYISTEEYAFTEDNYNAQGLNSISADLSLEQDAAAVYYGGIARMPSSQQFDELLEYTEITTEGNIFSIRSRVNGNVIRIDARGEFISDHITNPSYLYLWSRDYISDRGANCLAVTQALNASITSNVRYRGLLILPVKNS